MKPLKIAVYYPWVYLKGGIERSLAALISRSRHEWTIFTSHYEPANTFDEFTTFKVVQVGDVRCATRYGRCFEGHAPHHPHAPAARRIRCLWVCWCDGLAGTLTTFRNARIPTFCICSTPLRAVYDPVYAREALRSRQPLAKLGSHIFKHSFRFIDRLAWGRFDGVVATSREVKERIVRNRL